MIPFSRYIFVKTDMSGVEQANLSNREYSPDSYLHYHLSNREYSPDSYLHYHLAAELSLIDAWRNVCVLL